MVRRIAYAAAATAALFLAVPAAALPVSPASQPPSRARILIPLTLIKDQDLSFGTIISNPSSGVTVTIHPRTGVRGSSHPASMFPGDVGQRAIFAGAGAMNQQVVMELIPPAVLVSPANDEVTVIDLYMDTFDPITIPASRFFEVGVGGIIHVPANAPDGIYSAEYVITATYQ